MDPGSSKQRVREQSDRSRRAKANRSFAESPPSQLRHSSPTKDKRKNKSKEELGGEFYTIKAILDEKEEKSRTWYLIDWDDNSQTGEKYDTTWVEAKDVTQAAKKEWRQSKRNEKRNKQEINRQKKKEDWEDESSFPDSDPIRPAKRQRNQVDLESPPKKFWLVGTASSARYSVSQASEEAAEHSIQPEIKDSYEEDPLSSHPAAQQPHVIISPFPSDFDYTTFDYNAHRAVLSSQSTSQLSQASLLQPRQNSQHSQPSASTPAHPLKTPRGRPDFIWDENLETSPVIPDSQDLPGSSVYRLSEIQVSKTSETTQPDISPTQGILVEQTTSATVTKPSSSTSDQPIRGFGDSYQTHSIQSAPAASSSPEQFGQVLEVSQLRSPSSSTYPNRVSKTILNSAILSSSSEGTQSHPSPAIPNSLEKSSSARLSQNAEQEINAEDLHFLTQIPFSLPEDLATSSEPNIIAKSTRGSIKQNEFQRGTKSSQLDSPLQHHNLEPTQGTTSSEPWQEAQVASASLPSSRNIVSSIEEVVPLSRPSPPSSGYPQFPESYGSNPPQRPKANTDSMDDFDMDDNFGMSVAEMLKKARMDAQRSTIARQEAARRAASSVPSTPASIPSTPAPVPPPPVVNQLIPLREPSFATHTPIVAHVVSPQASPVPESAPCLQIIPLGPKQYIIPLSLTAHVQSLYMDELHNSRRQTRAFLHDGDVTFNSLNAMDHLIKRLEMICDHQDLIVEESISQDLNSDAGTAKWAENISTKCVFIVDFLNEIKTSNKHIVILARPGRMTSILEACFRFHRFGYRRFDQPEDRTHAGDTPLKITLIPTDINHKSSVLEPADVVIVFDSTFETERHFKNLRGDCTDLNLVAPIINLVVVHSVEHLELCIPKSLKALDRLTTIVTGLSKINEEYVGRLKEDYLLPDLAADAVAKFISGDLGKVWPLLPMPGIKDVEISYGTSLELVDYTLDWRIVLYPSLLPETKSTQSYSTNSQAPLKRPYDVDTESESSKRQRISPGNGECDSRTDQTHMSGVMLTSSAVTANSKITDLGESSKTDAAGEQGDLMATLLKKVSDLDNALQAKDAAEAELRQHNQRLEAQCKDLESSIQGIQPKYQEALNDRGRFEYESLEALRREDVMRKRHDNREQELNRLRNQNTALDAELRITRTALTSSTIPEVAEVYQAREELATRKTEQERLQKRISTMEKDLEYMRGNYQTASSAAFEAANELRDLTEANEVLKRKASDNTVRIHEIQASNELKIYVARIDELESEKMDLVRELEKKTEEFKTLTNGRRATRGTSVPMSPRMNTMSPSTRVNRVLGVMSRGNSPGPGEPLRGMFVAEAPLFATQGPRAWPNHLT